MLITIIKFSICKRFRLRLLLFAQKSEYGALAQLGAHHTGSVGVTGSNPVCSTTQQNQNTDFDALCILIGVLFYRGNSMSIIGLEWTFDTVACAYEKLRPGYVDELYRKLFDYVPLNGSSRVVEVGIGAGQATLPILSTDCKLTAVELGKHFSELCAEKFKVYPKFSVITGKFEDIDFESSSFDLVYSASAFHWIPEKTGYEKVFFMLKNGGVFARFANHPYRDKGNPAMSEEIDRIYDKYYYTYHNREREILREYDEDQARDRAYIAEKYGFTDIKYAIFQRTRTFSAEEYSALLGTYSDHIVIDEKIRNEFFSDIEKAISKHGGSITIYDTIDLQLARKP